MIQGCRWAFSGPIGSGSSKSIAAIWNSRIGRGMEVPEEADVVQRQAKLPASIQRLGQISYEGERLHVVDRIQWLCACTWVGYKTLYILHCYRGGQYDCGAVCITTCSTIKAQTWFLQNSGRGEGDRYTILNVYWTCVCSILWTGTERSWLFVVSCRHNTSECSPERWNGYCI